ncbi:hypothetical protein MRX96_054126 [Rhipicephalus microplus]
MWPHRPPPPDRRDLLRMMFHCDYTLGCGAVFSVVPELFLNSTTGYVITYTGFNFIVRKRCNKLEDKMFGPLMADLDKNTPNAARVPDHMVYSTSANMSKQRWTEMMQREGVAVVGTLRFYAWNLPYLSTFFQPVGAPRGAGYVRLRILVHGAGAVTALRLRIICTLYASQ